MKVGVNGRFYGAELSGVQRFARETAARLFSRVDDVVLFLPADVAPPEGLEERVRVVRGRLRGRVWEHVELPWRARAERCDVVLNLANVGPVFGGPHVVVIHDVLAVTNPEWFSRKFATWYRFVQARSARRAARVATVSDWARGELVRVFGLDPERVGIALQGIEPFDRPASAEAIRLARRRWALPDTYLLTVAGGDPRKNLRFLLEVLARWRGMRGVAPPLIVVGGERQAVHGSVSGRDAAAGGYGEAEIRAAGDVRFLGRVSDEDLRALYTAATVFCFPSLAEGFGRPPLEAMACGTPAVVAPYGPAREVVEGAALIVDLQPTRWVEAIERLIESPEERRALAEAGRRHALRFRWDATADAVLALCREVALGGRGEPPVVVPMPPDASALAVAARPEAADPDVVPLASVRVARRRLHGVLPGPGFRRARSAHDSAAVPEPAAGEHEALEEE
ncbi:MAG: glycosyltransferase family 1 protein [bacterium]|jgi:glycosyltransferase involved in cell wall biosynthesis